MIGHVNDLGSLPDSPESGLTYCFGFTYEGHNRSVGIPSRVNIKQHNALYRGNFIGYLFYFFHVASLTEIGNTFYQTGTGHIYYGLNTKYSKGKNYSIMYLSMLQALRIIIAYCRPADC